MDINECHSNPCQNDATCLDKIGGFTCLCMPGFKGVHCEEDIDECLSNPCVNNGECLDKVNRFLCVCPPGEYLFLEAFPASPYQELMR
ncbi:hypothetical protein CIB84_015296 [Bambusicola thoracicus]|uniref:EGF-like domain-containing protein n=1 Tax=Bambusicola thoracicus TaxID=9083 RepID=A0A2P4SA32_BAMTH|nr:hypothetical protein CIB84_015296 [Bambusicola thoracicus]